MDCITGYTAITNRQFGTALFLGTLWAPIHLQAHKDQVSSSLLLSSEERWKGGSCRGQAALGSLPFSTLCPEISSRLESSLRNPLSNWRGSSHLLPRLKSNCFPCALSRLTPLSTRQWLQNGILPSYNSYLASPMRSSASPPHNQSHTSHTSSLLLPCPCHCLTFGLPSFHPSSSSLTAKSPASRSGKAGLPSTLLYF